METPIAFPDAAGALIAYLGGLLPTYGVTDPVVKEVPGERPARFIQVFRTGGPRRNLVIDAAQLTISCWAATDQAAADLARIVRAVLLAIRGDIVDGALLYGVSEISGPVDLPDPTSKQSRMTWSVSALTRGTDLTPVP